MSYAGYPFPFPPYPPPFLTPSPSPSPQLPPVYGPPLPPEPEIPWFLQCGRCGEPVQGKTPRSPTPIDAHNSKCSGPYPVHMDFPCPGPFFDIHIPEEIQNHCCICLRPCEIDDKDRMKSAMDVTTGKWVSYERNKDQLHWHHKSAEL